MTHPPALQMEGLSHRIGGTDILRQVDLTVRAGERLGLIGPNGAGKTTLFNLISGRQTPTAGRILLHGQPITGLSPTAIHRRGLARSFQITQLFPSLSVLDNLRCALMHRHGLGLCFWRALAGHAALNAQAQALLGPLQLTPHQDTPAQQLSYADQRALELGLTLAGDSPVLLLDEPTAGMSHSESRRVVRLIRDMTPGRTLVLIEHDMGVVFELAERIAVLASGQVLACDSPERIRSHAAVQAIYLGQTPAQAR